MAARLVPWPRAALALVGVCLAVAIAGAVKFHDDVQPTGLDARFSSWVGKTFSTSALETALKLTTPGWVTGIIALTALFVLLQRRFRLATVAALGPAIAVVLTEYVLKPLVHREFGGTVVVNGRELYAYPSGHETGVASLTTVLVLVLIAYTDSRMALLAGVAAAVVIDVVAAIALVGNHYHFVTDTVGAIALSVAIIVGLALAVDAVVEWRWASG
jgi:undecaprenyl-diphosphatase